MTAGGHIRRCSGDDAVNIAGDAAPVFRGCELQAKKCGVRAFDTARGVFDCCRINDCGEQGVKLMEDARLTLTGCAQRIIVPSCDRLACSEARCAANHQLTI